MRTNTVDARQPMVTRLLLYEDARASLILRSQLLQFVDAPGCRDVNPCRFHLVSSIALAIHLQIAIRFHFQHAAGTAQPPSNGRFRIGRFRLWAHEEKAHHPVARLLLVFLLLVCGLYHFSPSAASNVSVPP